MHMHTRCNAHATSVCVCGGGGRASRRIAPNPKPAFREGTQGICRGGCGRGLGNKARDRPPLTAPGRNSAFPGSAPVSRPIQLEPSTLRPPGFVWVPGGWPPRIDLQIKAESQRDWWGAHWAPLLGRPENRAPGLKIRATARPETRPGIVGRSGRPMSIGPKQKSMATAYLVQFLWPKPCFFVNLGPAEQP